MLRANNIIEFVSFETSVNAKFVKRILLIKLERGLKLINSLLGQKVLLNLAVEIDNYTGLKLSKHR